MLRLCLTFNIFLMIVEDLYAASNIVKKFLIVQEKFSKPHFLGLQVLMSLSWTTQFIQQHSA